MKVLKKLFFEGYWECFYRKMQENNQDINQWKKVRIGRRYWCADPFLFSYKGEENIFCEVMDRKKSYGMLGCGRIIEDGVTRISVIKDIGCHTSYPNIFCWNGNIYMIPETVERHSIELYQCADFPKKWFRIAVLKENINAVDTTVYITDTGIKLFIYEVEKDAYVLKIGDLDLKGKTIKNINNIYRYNQKTGRPAGNIILNDNQSIRPTQYGVNFYGEKIIFKRFSLNYTADGPQYEEENVSEKTVCDIEPAAKKKFKGTHTYNIDSGYEIMDCYKKKFYIERPFQLLMKKFHLGGYGFHG